MNRATSRNEKEQTVAAEGNTDRTPSAERLEAVRHQEHQWCFACGEHHPFGLKLKFLPDGEGSVRATFACGKSYEGYGDRLHGGIVSTLLDSAMVSWLMAAGITAYTADLQIRFHLPIEVGVDAEIRAIRRRRQGPIHRMEAQLFQNGQRRASARGCFLETKPMADA